MATSFFSNVKNLLQPSSQATPSTIFVTGVDSYGELPQGFFRVLAASGKESLGYNCALFLCWDCGKTVVVGPHRVTLDKPLADLPLVKLSFSKQAEGVHHVGGLSVIDTESLNDNDGAVSWGGQTIRDGVDYV